jgi:GAF domain-containing protein
MSTTSLDADRGLSAGGLRDLLAMVNSSRGLDEILDYLAVLAGQVLNCDGVGLYLKDPLDPAALVVQASHGVPDDLLTVSAPLGYPLIGLAVTRRQIVVVADVPTALEQPIVQTVDAQLVDRGSYLEVLRPGPQSTDPSQRERNQRLAASYRTIAAVPLAASEETYGSLVLYYHAANAYTPEYVDLSVALAQHAALAIENANLRSQAQQRLIEIVRRQRVAEALRDLLAVVNSNHNLDEILSEVLSQSSRLLGNDAGVVYLLDDASDMLQVRATQGLERRNLALQMRRGSPITGLAVEQGRALVTCDFQAALDVLDGAVATQPIVEDLGTYGRVVRMGGRVDDDLEHHHAMARLQRLARDFPAVLAIPLIARGRAFGAITLFYRQPRVFSSEEVELGRTFAEQVTLAIVNARLHVEAGQRIRENESRRRVAEGMRDLLASVNSTRSLDEVMDLVLKQSADLLGSDAGSILLLDAQQGKQAILTVRASRALVSDIVPTRLPVGSAITGIAVERGRPVAVTDLLDAVPDPGQVEAQLEDRPGFLRIKRVGSPPSSETEGVDLPRIRDIARYYRALLAVPLAVRGRMHGAITLYYRRPREFSTEDVQLAEAFADQTALAIENAQLHTQTVRRSRDLEALYRADEALHRSLRLDQVLQALVDVAADVLESDMSSVLVWDEQREHLVAGAARGFRPEVVALMRHPRGEGIAVRVATGGEPIAVEDVANDPRVARQITDAEGIQSLLHVPIKVNGEVFGVFGVNYRTRRALTGEEERVMLALAHRAAVAIENARLFAESEHRLHELEALYRADEALHRSLLLGDVMRALTDVAADVLQADKTSVHIWDPAHRYLVAAASFGYSSETLALPLVPGEDLLIDESLGVNVMTVADARTDRRFSSPRLRELVQRENVRAAIAASITVAGQAFGLFTVAFCVPRLPTRDEERLVQALAQRAGLAIQNARLFEQAQQVATAEERQRLARELHDAVTQTLFSASLIAEVVPRLWERNPDEGRTRLEELRRLTRGALAEMRTLLLELRPAALVETPFSQLLHQLAEATASRTNLQIDVDVSVPEGPDQLTPEIKLALYRIAQEALNNTSKHSGARHAEVHLRVQPASLHLHLLDDGRGFDPGRTPPGHLGLGIMHERARAIGARLRIQSKPGAGTGVHVRVRRATR